MDKESPNSSHNASIHVEASSELVGVIEDIQSILSAARQQAYSAVNFIMVRAYWLVGRKIVSHEQAGRVRAGYGEHLLSRIAKEISKGFDKNLSVRRVREIRQFYLKFYIR